MAMGEKAKHGFAGAQEYPPLAKGCILEHRQGYFQGQLPKRFSLMQALKRAFSRGRVLIFASWEAPSTLTTFPSLSIEHHHHDT